MAVLIPDGANQRGSVCGSHTAALCLNSVLVDIFSPITGYFNESIERKNPSSTKADAGYCKWSKLRRPEARILKKIMKYQSCSLVLMELHSMIQLEAN